MAFFDYVGPPATMAQINSPCYRHWASNRVDCQQEEGSSIKIPKATSSEDAKIYKNLYGTNVKTRKNKQEIKSQSKLVQFTADSRGIHRLFVSYRYGKFGRALFSITDEKRRNEDEIWSQAKLVLCTEGVSPDIYQLFKRCRHGQTITLLVDIVEEREDMKRKVLQKESFKIYPDMKRIRRILKEEKRKEKQLNHGRSQ